MAAERPLSDRRIYSARPTVKVDGRFYERTSRLLQAMQMTEDEGGMSALELRYSNLASHEGGGASLAFEDDQLLRLGAAISVHAGDEQQPQEIFRGRITAIELELSQLGPPELVVLAEDGLQAARMTRRTEVHRNQSIADLARAIAQRAGLRASVTGFTDRLGVEVQLNESDLAFLRRLLRCHDGDLQVVGDELQVAPRADVQRDRVALVMFGQLSRARVTADLAHQVTAVTVTGWDSDQAQKITRTSRGRALGPGAGRTGAQILEQALGARSEHLGKAPVVTDSEARALADAAYDQRARRFVLLEGTSDGNPGLRVGVHVEVRGLGPRFDNTFYVTRACHRYDTRGYLTDFEAECAYLGGAA
jgi:phage protein D